jgi:hypothetical protein
MWGVIFLIVFFMFFRRTSGFAVGQTSVFDLSEFKSLPSDMKASLKTGINGVMDALGKRISSAWNSYTPQEKSKLLAKYKNGFSQYIEDLKAAPPLNKDELDFHSYNKTPLSPPPMMMAPATSLSQCPPGQNFYPGTINFNAGNIYIDGDVYPTGICMSASSFSQLPPGAYVPSTTSMAAPAPMMAPPPPMMAAPVGFHY